MIDPKPKHTPAGVDDTRGLALIAKENYSGSPLAQKRAQRFASMIDKAERGERLDKQDIALLKRLKKLGMEWFIFN